MDESLWDDLRSSPVGWHIIRIGAVPDIEFMRGPGGPSLDSDAVGKFKSVPQLLRLQRMAVFLLICCSSMGFQPLLACLCEMNFHHSKAAVFYFCFSCAWECRAIQSRGKYTMKSSESPEVKDLKLPTILMTNQWLHHGNGQKNTWRGNHKQFGALKEHKREKNGNYIMFSLFCARTAMYSLIPSAGESKTFKRAP